MKVELYREVMVTRNMPEQQILAGDVATVVDYVSHPEGGEEGAVLEIFNAVGESIGVVVVPLSAIAPLHAGQILTVRSLAVAA
jgi:hypothetical protein